MSVAPSAGLITVIGGYLILDWDDRKEGTLLGTAKLYLSGYSQEKKREVLGKLIQHVIDEKSPVPPDAVIVDLLKRGRYTLKSLNMRVDSATPNAIPDYGLVYIMGTVSRRQ